MHSPRERAHKVNHDAQSKWRTAGFASGRAENPSPPPHNPVSSSSSAYTPFSARAHRLDGLEKIREHLNLAVHNAGSSSRCIHPRSREQVFGCGM